MLKNINKKGFTLLELVIVITILAILAAVAVQSFSGQGQGAKTSAHLSNLSQIENAAERYEVDFNWQESDFHTVIDSSHKLVSLGYLRKAVINPWKNDSAMEATDFGYVLDFNIIEINGKLKLQPVPRLVKLDAAGKVHSDKKEITNDIDNPSVADFTPGDTTDANYTEYFN
ncbi:MAG: hypothetical protein A2Y24_08065 [Clostridiales bacterium GWE2_32_10]|nr:MAG: hypothetical protein A2Y24_08065 [Clostridiales bacterium GWE2_32_10]